MNIPKPTNPSVLRNVLLSGTGWRLMTWETGRVDEQHPSLRCFARSYLGYAFFPPGKEEPLFSGDDYGCAPGTAIDSDESLRGLLGFLTLRPGDTDDEYFDKYTPEQLDYCRTDAEELSLWADEDLTEGPETFEDIEP